MPSPFPGMDPYLEDPTTWPGTHNKLITHLEEALNAILPEPYIAECEMRCFIERPDDILIPDVTMRETERAGRLATLENTSAAISPFLRVEVRTIEVREAYINILHGRDFERIVTTIELLSHTNKAAQGRGQREYQNKQRRVLESQTHLIEIDLLRAGKPTVAVPISALPPEPPYDYLACLSRWEQRDMFQVWPATVRDPLPCIAVPLDEGIPDISLDLQSVFERFYDAGFYSRRLDYMQPPVPPLQKEDAAWADALLRERGFRNAF